MSYAIIYATDTRDVLRLITSTDPGYDFAVHVGPGEGLLMGDEERGVDINVARSLLDSTP